jgi:phosphonatase-like hydrolase
MNILACRGISLMVCDMVGTVINEGGVVYKTLYNTLKNNDIPVKATEISDWHDLQKEEVISSMVNKYLSGPTYGSRYFEQENLNQIKSHCYDEFEENLKEAYFGEHSKIELIDPNLPNFFNRLRFNGVKIALNTGYNRTLQRDIINHLQMEDYIDDFISSEDVKMGRPAPYMIHRLMERHNIMNAEYVAKVGDTRNDMLEGKNAGCGINIGVLTGVSNAGELLDADLVVDKITNIDMIIEDGFFL